MKDQLSALIDGEFEIESSEHILTSVKSGGELKEAWQHYHLIGDAIRGELGRGNVNMRHDFSTRVMQALDAEPAVLGVIRDTPAGDAPPVKYQLKSKLKNAKYWSVAASVAAVMFVGLILLQQQFGQSNNLAPIEIAQTMPTEYLEAHQAAAPSSSSYYIQAASFSPTETQK